MFTQMKIGDHIVLVLEESAVDALVVRIDEEIVLAISTLHVTSKQGKNPDVHFTENVPHHRFGSDARPHYWVPGVDAVLPAKSKGYDMPYIPKKEREGLHSFTPAESPGELNYLFTAAIVEYLDLQGTSYGVLNSVIGVLECAKLELYRRIAVPYEDEKIKENGDVY